ncbi:hypothetical protein FQN50_002198 [Emmonsiellopsis sp. PD_5]|nr:hypothetical protein FQN50_002198 [Emmonsiellopsis sp. PD_5]
MATFTNLAIVRRDLGGQLSEPSTDSDEYTFVATSIYLGLELLSTPHIRHCLALQALDYDKSLEQPGWYGALQEDVTLALDLVNSFLDAVWNIFPLLCIDETIPTLDCLGYHPRGEWSGVFNPRGQAVNINAQRVDDMVTSAAIPDGVNFRIFQFLFAHTFLHEVGGHMFITYLSQGCRPLTPPTLSHILYGTEAGRALEREAFGGALEYYCDTSQSMHQPGIPHLLDTDQMAHRISQTCIDNFVVSRIMEFPYTLEGEPQNADNFQSMGAGTIVENFMPGPYMIARAQIELETIRGPTWIYGLSFLSSLGQPSEERLRYAREKGEVGFDRPELFMEGVAGGSGELEAASEADVVRRDRVLQWPSSASGSDAFSGLPAVYNESCSTSSIPILTSSAVTV